VVERFLRVLWFYTSIGVNMHELAHHMFGLKHFPAPSQHGLLGTGAYGAEPGRTGLYGLLRDGTRPTHMIGYHKVVAGFVEPTEITATALGFELRSASTGEYNVVRLPLATGALYLENRTAEGYDQSVPFCAGHQGGLFATDVADRIGPYNLVQAAGFRGTATYDTNLTPDFCEYYALAGHNDSQQLGRYTIANVSAAGSTMTLDITVSDEVPAIDHYKLRYAAAAADGSLLWRHVLLEPAGSIDIDVATFTNAADPAAYRTLELVAYYTTGEVRSANVEAELTASAPYVRFVKSYAPEEGDLVRQGIIALSFESTQPYQANVTVDVTAGGFQSSFRLLNLPRY
jgi:hypothetical protein